MSATPAAAGEGWTLYCGEALDVLRHLPSGSVDAVICDPPYSSGGFTRGDRNQTPAQKYQQSDTKRVYGEFGGDNRDSRSYAYWCQLWQSECLRLVKPSGYLLTFSDWRQLPTTTDAIQAAGWVWRGVIAWNKGRGARSPHTGLPRHQCEYVVTATKGVSRPSSHGGPLDGCFTFPVLQSDKFHTTGKPTPIMRELVKIVPPGAVVLDPFGGSHTTGVACVAEGRKYVGIEQSDHYHEVGKGRIEAAARTAKLHRP